MAPRWLCLRHWKIRPCAAGVGWHFNLGQGGGGGEKVAGKFGVTRIDREMLDRWRADQTRTTYLFDVRDPDEFKVGHPPGAISAPGGQLVQATDIYAGVLQSRIVVCDDKEVRALMTAAWLKQMGLEGCVRSA